MDSGHPIRPVAKLGLRDADYLFASMTGKPLGHRSNLAVRRPLTWMLVTHTRKLTNRAAPAASSQAVNRRRPW
jgi:hypothetical protein